MQNNLLMSAIAPHPPVIIPEVGGEELKKIQKTVTALKKLSEEITKLNPDTVVIVTPHSSFNHYFFSIYNDKKLEGSFSKFGASGVKIAYDNDVEFVEELNNLVKENFRKLNILPAGMSLDHGSTVPLYYFKQAGYKNKIVVINYTALGKKEHNLFGAKITEAARKLGRKIVFIASGDLSHKLIPGAPAGFDEEAHRFDDLIVESIKTGNYNEIQEINSQMRQLAGECGYNSLMVAFGLTEGKPLNNEVLSYEAPFGVGYIVAKL